MSSQPRGRRARWGALACSLAIVVPACTGDSAPTTTAGPTTTAEVETTTSAPTTTLAGACEEVFCVRYDIHPDAAWADGVAVTAEDFAFTYETIVDPEVEIFNRQGYDRITGYEIVDDKTIVFAFAEIYAPWQTLFRPVLPRHALEGQPFNTAWDDAITVGSGPFVFTESVPDEHIVLTRNPAYWGDATGDVQSVEIVFPDDLDDQVDALRAGEIDMFYPEPTAELVEEVTNMSGVEWEAGLGTVWEHLSFNFDDSRLGNRFVRQAIAQGIDRDAIVEAIVRPIAADAQPLGNSVWMNTSSNYQDHFNARFPYDPVAAEALLVENGCARGEDAIYVCAGQRLSFGWSATAGNEWRQLQFELAQESLAAIGIEVTAMFGPASQLFAEQYFYGGADTWQLFNFAWVGSYEPAGQNTLYHCEGDAPNGFGTLNNIRYCNDEVDSLIRATDTQIDPTERAATYNQADDLWLGDVPIVPLYQKPSFLAWNSAIQGPQDNSTEIGPFWNIGNWTGKEVVVFGADEPPESMNVLERDGRLLVSSLVSNAVLEGAFIVTPDFEYVPQLVTGAEPIIP